LRITTMALGAQDNLARANVEIFARIYQAYLECADDTQEAVRNMLAIVNAPDADSDEKEMALDTIVEALFPQYDQKGEYGLSLEDLDDDHFEDDSDTRATRESLDREEATFSENLARLMEEKGVSQIQLAEKASVGQPAISNMLKRNCRPQQRTVRKLAEALGVDAKELWPFHRTGE